MTREEIAHIHTVCVLRRRVVSSRRCLPSSICRNETCLHDLLRVRHDRPDCHRVLGFYSLSGRLAGFICATPPERNLLSHLSHITFPSQCFTGRAPPFPVVPHESSISTSSFSFPRSICACF